MSFLDGVVHNDSPIRTSLLEQLAIADIVSLFVATKFKPTESDFDRYIFCRETNFPAEMYDLDFYIRCLTHDPSRKGCLPRYPPSLTALPYGSYHERRCGFGRRRREVSPARLRYRHCESYHRVPASILTAGEPSLPYPPLHLCFTDNKERAENGPERSNKSQYDYALSKSSVVEQQREELNEGVDTSSTTHAEHTIAWIHHSVYTEIVDDQAERDKLNHAPYICKQDREQLPQPAVCHISRYCLVTDVRLRPWIEQHGASQWRKFVDTAKYACEHALCLPCTEFDERTSVIRITQRRTRSCTPYWVCHGRPSDSLLCAVKNRYDGPVRGVKELMTTGYRGVKIYDTSNVHDEAYTPQTFADFLEHIVDWRNSLDKVCMCEQDALRTATVCCAARRDLAHRWCFVEGGP